MKFPCRVMPAEDGATAEPFTYLLCPDGTLERLSPRPSAGEIGSYYGSDYVPHSAPQRFRFADRVKQLVYHTHWAPEGEVPGRVRAWRPLLRLLLRPVRHRSVLSFTRPALRRVFEFGAAQAADLLTFKAAGWWWWSRRAPHAMRPLSLLGQAAGHGDWMRVVARRLPVPALDEQAGVPPLAA